ncbi:MAG: hypothetical protein QM773_15695 [Hyphomonadaceae bacterium]
MKLQFSLCVAALAVAACSPAPAEDADAGKSEKRLPLPDCATVQAADQGADGWKHPDCRAMFADQSGMAIEARYKPAEDDSTEVTVQVVAKGDATVQTIDERMGNTFSAPSLEDFDKDGKIDILVPLETGNVNTTWAAWRQVDGGKFVRVGEPSGVSIEKTASGYIATPARSAANEWGISFYKLEADQLQPVLTADVVAQGEPNKITGVECTIEDDGGLPATGLTLEAAKTQFCAEPIVTEIFKP